MEWLHFCKFLSIEQMLDCHSHGYPIGPFTKPHLPEKVSTIQDFSACGFEQSLTTY